MQRLKTLLVLCFLPLLISAQQQFDVVIYGGTSAGIASAIQCSRMNKSVLLIEPGNRIGGLTTGGLGQTDIGNKSAIGGISREFYEGIKAHYDKPESWRWQKKSEYRDGGQTRTTEGEASMWTFEPSAALSVYETMIAEESIELVKNERLNRTDGVEKNGNKIVSITMESGKKYAASMFIDATYEGDLMATAGVTYTVGREGNEAYGETLNGVQANFLSQSLTGLVSKNAYNHNFTPGVDPYIVKGDRSSGLLPFVNEKPGLDGKGDKKVQAYCFRMCLTDHPENRIPFEKPASYNELNYELLLRNYEAREMQYGDYFLPWINSSMPNRKTDTNNRTGFSTDFIGGNYNYPEATYAEREEIIKAHRDYQKGLMWTLANHPRIPAPVRKEMSRWGTSRDEFEREDGWQNQLYVREARRMVSDYVMTQYNCEGLHVCNDAVGLAAYGMDSHNIQRYVDANGYVQNEGNVECHGFGPYPISYKSITPRKSECGNLMVPVCVSATHIAFGSIRMEPVFMVLGQSAATAAVMAIDADCDVQDLPYQQLKKRLQKDGQRF